MELSCPAEARIFSCRCCGSGGGEKEGIDQKMRFVFLPRSASSTGRLVYLRPSDLSPAGQRTPNIFRLRKSYLPVLGVARSLISEPLRCCSTPRFRMTNRPPARFQSKQEERQHRNQQQLESPPTSSQKHSSSKKLSININKDEVSERTLPLTWWCSKTMSWCKNKCPVTCWSHDGNIAEILQAAATGCCRGRSSRRSSRQDIQTCKHI